MNADRAASEGPPRSYTPAPNIADDGYDENFNDLVDRFESRTGGTAHIASRVGELTSRLLTSAQLDTIPEAEPLIQDAISIGSLVFLYGKEKTGKSLVAGSWAGCVSTGRAWFGHQVTKGAVLVVGAEGRGGLRKRVRAWEQQNGVESGVTFLPVDVQLLSPVDAAAIRIVIRNMGAVLVIFDTQSRMTVGADENSGVDMGRLIETAASIIDNGQRTVAFNTHEPKASETIRGHSSLAAASDHTFRTERNGDVIQLINTAQKDLDTLQTLQFRLEKLWGSVVLTCIDADEFSKRSLESKPNMRAVLQGLQELLPGFGEQAGPLIKASGLSSSSWYSAMKSLVSAGLVVKDDTVYPARWRLT